MFSQAIWCHCQVSIHICVHPNRHTHLRTSTKILHKGISLAQGFFQKQRRHANGARGTVILFRTCKESYLPFLCFWRQHSHEVAKQFGFIPMYYHVLAYIQRSFGQEDFNSTGTISKADRACQWDGETVALLREYRKSSRFFFHCFW